MSYCRKCGTETVKVWTGYFDTNTGEKEMADKCPVEDCDHLRHDWKIIKDGFFSSTYRCNRCNETTVVENIEY